MLIKIVILKMLVDIAYDSYFFNPNVNKVVTSIHLTQEEEEEEGEKEE